MGTEILCCALPLIHYRSLGNDFSFHPNSHAHQQHSQLAQDLLSGLHIDLSDCLVLEMEAGHGQLLNEIMEHHPGG